MPKKKEKKLTKKQKKAALKAAKKAAKKALKAKKKAAKKAKKLAKKVAKGTKKAAKKPSKKVGKPAKKAAAALPASKKAATASHRLPPGLRHVVEEDEERERVGEKDDAAFVGTDTNEDEAKQRGEEFVRSATSGEEAESEMEEEEADEEQGGPFLRTSGRTEFGYGTDASNPSDAEPAGLPSVSPPVKPKLDD